MPRPARPRGPSRLLLLALLLAGAAPPRAGARECFPYETLPGGPGTPVVGGLVTTQPALELAVQAGHVYVAIGAGGLEVIELTDLRFPAWVSTFTGAGAVDQVAVSGGYAYVSAGAGFAVVDIAAADNLLYVESLGLAGAARDLRAGGGWLYAAVSDSGLQVVDVSNPPLPRRAARLPLPGEARAVAVDGALGVVATSSHLAVVDLAAPAAPVLLAALAMTGGATAVGLAPGLACVTAGGDLVAVDLSDPADPRARGRCDLPADARELLVAPPFAYAACGDAGLWVFDVRDPDQVRRVGSLAPPEGVRAVAWGVERLFLSCGAAGLRIALPQCPDVTAAPFVAAATAGPRLHPPCPNPANPRTEIRFSLPAPAPVRLAVHDLRGRRVATLLEGRLPAGERGVAWDGRDGGGAPAPSGAYVLRLEAGDARCARRVLLVR